MTTHEIELYFRQHRRLLAVLLLVVGMTAVSGAFLGMRQTVDATATDRPLAAEAAAGAHPTAVPTAPRYAEIRDAGWLANAGWQFTLQQLPDAPLTREPMPAPTADELLRALAARGTRRAFDGAPPVIPHQIDTISVASCVLCHGQDATLVIDGRRPPVMSHAAYTSCTQCHVPADGLRQLSEAERLVVGTAFDGKQAPDRGCRAYAGAPPAMPHPVFMRENCMACHGPDRPNAIRSSHPQRQNCLQCHAQDAQLDNRERSPAPPRP